MLLKGAVSKILLYVMSLSENEDVKTKRTDKNWSALEYFNARATSCIDSTDTRFASNRKDELSFAIETFAGRNHAK